MRRYWKGIIAAVVAVAITVTQAVESALHDGSWGQEDTIVVLLAFLGAVAVYFKGNDVPPGKRPDPNVSERGYTIIELLIGFIFALILLVILLKLLNVAL